MINFNIIKKLKLVFNIGKEKKKQSIGILNKGKNNTYINNRFKGRDIGIKDEGEGTNAVDNKFFENQKIN